MTSGILAAAPASSNVTPGVLGFLVVAAMGVALVFLLRSMNKQFRKITPEAGQACRDHRDHRDHSHRCHRVQARSGRDARPGTPCVTPSRRSAATLS